MGPFVHKKKKKRSFDQSTLNRVIWAHLSKKIKRGLSTTDHYAEHCTVTHTVHFLRISAGRNALALRYNQV